MLCISDLACIDQYAHAPLRCIILWIRFCHSFSTNLSFVR